MTGVCNQGNKAVIKGACNGALSGSLPMQFLEQFLHPIDIGRELFWILLCIGFVNLQRFLECPTSLFCLVLITIKNSQVVECQRDVRQRYRAGRKFSTL